MASVNKAMLLGNLGHDPEVRYAPSGDKVASFSLATTNRWKDARTGEPKEVTEWHRVSAFGKLADVVEKYAHKGDPLFVIGSIEYRKYTGRDNAERTSTQIRANEIQLIGSRRDEGGERERAPAAQSPAPSRAPAPATSTGSGFDDMDDDIPF